MSVLILCRHGNTFEANQPAVWVGARTDLPLTAEGEAQATRAAAWIRALNTPLAALVAGPLRRTRRFAEIISATVDRPVALDDRLKEIDYGVWEGLTSEAIIARYGSAALTAWEKKGAWPQTMRWEPPLDTLNAALASFLAQERAHLLANPTEPRCAVTSNGILRLLHRLITQTPDDTPAKVKTGHLCLLAPTEQGWRITHWNENPATLPPSVR